MKIWEHSFIDLKGKESDFIVLFPIGFTEAHGYHMPLGTDFLVPQKVVDMVEDKVPNSLVLFPLAYGFDTKHIGFSGTLHVRLETFKNLIFDIVDSMVDQGFRNFVLLNGHKPQFWPIWFAANEVAQEKKRLGIKFKAMCLNWWDILGEKTAQTFPGKTDFNHGGRAETSTVMAVDEKIVKLDRAEYKTVIKPTYKMVPDDEYYFSPYACYADPSQASAKDGMVILEEAAENLVKAIYKEFNLGEAH